MNCPTLSHFDIRDREAVRAAFSDAPIMEMQQAWRVAPEDGFLPAQVRIGWRHDCFLVLGELTDPHLYTSATEDNQILCSFGDVFEIFLRDSKLAIYAEFHVAPNGRRLQLLWPDAETIRRVQDKKVALDDLKVHEPIFDFSQWSEGEKWYICASVSTRIFLPPGTPLEGRTWMASFSRYDYSSAEEPPVLSSTSPHTGKVSFHSQQDWTELSFC